MSRFKALNHPLIFLRTTRPYSQLPAAHTIVTYPYFIPRNSRGSLPVYTDIRNGGTRYLILLNNIQGDINSLRDHLVSSLFKTGSDESARLRVQIAQHNKIILSGGRWKHHLTDWLRRRGF